MPHIQQSPALVLVVTALITVTFIRKLIHIQNFIHRWHSLAHLPCSHHALWEDPTCRSGQIIAQVITVPLHLAVHRPWDPSESPLLHQACHAFWRFRVVLPIQACCSARVSFVAPLTLHSIFLWLHPEFVPYMPAVPTE